jgi:hypothetical protein
MAFAVGPASMHRSFEIEWRGNHRYPLSIRCMGSILQVLPSTPCYERAPQDVSPPPEVQHHRNATLRGHEENYRRDPGGRRPSIRE